MTPKTLQPESEYAKYDSDGDGVVTDDELEISARLQELEMLHEKSDAQRNMVWFALFGMLLYPSGVAICSFFGLDDPLFCCQTWRTCISWQPGVL